MGTRVHFPGTTPSSVNRFLPGPVPRPHSYSWLPNPAMPQPLKSPLPQYISLPLQPTVLSLTCADSTHKKGPSDNWPTPAGSSRTLVWEQHRTQKLL